MMFQEQLGTKQKGLGIEGYDGTSRDITWYIKDFWNTWKIFCSTVYEQSLQEMLRKARQQQHNRKAKQHNTQLAQNSHVQLLWISAKKCNRHYAERCQKQLVVEREFTKLVEGVTNRIATALDTGCYISSRTQIHCSMQVALCSFTALTKVSCDTYVCIAYRSLGHSVSVTI